MFHQVDDFVGSLNCETPAPEWKDFIKIVRFGGSLVYYFVDIQFAMLFGMFFGSYML